MSRSPSRARVLVPTTAGVVEIERLLEEHIDRSVICVGASSIHNPRLDKAYSDFVAAGTGVIERCYRHGSFRLEVSQEIDHGSSWQLAAFIAHALHHAGRLAEKDQEADTIVWATGEVRYDLSVAAVGHIEDKLLLSLQYLTSKVAAGHRVLVVLPKANKQAASPWFTDLQNAGVEVVALERIHDVLRLLNLTLVTGKAASKPRSKGRKYAVVGGAGIGVVAVALAAAFHTWDDRAIVLTLPKTEYVIGEPFSFVVRANRDCRFLVLTVDGAGKPTLHDPAIEGDFMGDVVLKARERRKIPVAGIATVEPPSGVYLIGAVCNKEELVQLGLGEGAPRPRRNFRFKQPDGEYKVDRDAFNKLAVSYEVKER